MITIFSTCKPFDARPGSGFDVAQYNAIHSWAHLHPDVEIILFGDEEGTAELAAEVGAIHVPRVTKHANRYPLISEMFRRAGEMASHEIRAYINSDILFLDDLLPAVQIVADCFDDFMIVGRRYNMSTRRFRFDIPDWLGVAWSTVRLARAQSTTGMDYFIYRGQEIWDDLPPLAVACFMWDTWMLWWALHNGLPVVDIGQVVIAAHHVHQLRVGPQNPCRDYNRSLVPDEVWKAVLHGTQAAPYELMPDGSIRERNCAERLINEGYIFEGKEII